MARAFVAAEGARLATIPVALTSAPSGAYVLEAEGRALFGLTPGRMRLVIALSDEPARLDRLDGARLEDARSASGLRLIESEIDYQPQGGAP